MRRHIEALLTMKKRQQQKRDGNRSGIHHPKDVPDLCLCLYTWLTKKHGEVENYLTQIANETLVVSKHINTVLGWTMMRHTLSVDANPVFFQCPRFNGKRKILQQNVQQQLCSENTIGEILSWKTSEMRYHTMRHV